MRFAIISMFVVLSLISPAFAIQNVEEGAHTFEGKLVKNARGPMLLIDPGSFSQLVLSVAGETPEIEARIKELAVEEREFGDVYADRPTLKCSGAVLIRDKFYAFVISKLDEAGASESAEIAALEQIAASTAKIFEGENRVQAQAIARAAIPLAQELARTAAPGLAERARAALRRLQEVVR